jgi:phospholipid transport system substrate-binding protein
MRNSRIAPRFALIAAAALFAGTVAPLLPAQAQAPAAATAQDPSQVVQGVASSILKALEANRDVYRRDSTKREQLVAQYLLPHLQTELAARLVLGQHWRDATPEQRKRFIDAFYHSMLANYGTAIAEFTAGRLTVFPTPVEPGQKRATVRSEIKRDSGAPVSVNYSMELTDQGWQAYDVSVEGISYVKSYRDDFAAQIDAQGLDAVITRLEKGEKPEAIKAPRR